MKQISQKEIESIFTSTDFRISFITREDVNIRYCYISQGDVSLCCLSGNISDDQTFDKISFTPAISNTDLTGPPAFTPVPLAAGFSITLLAPSTPMIS